MRVFENGLLRKISGPKTEKGAGGWRRLHNEELHNLYASSNVIRVFKPRGMRLAGHVARMGEMKMNEIFCLENLKARDHLEDLDVDGNIIF
jgi:hypothetical protein